ncbi:MAG: CTP synthase [Candidatus Solibacter usitatus]|nr:CTP synthase [Candidatus Solibacter usitatus]
MLRVSVIGDFDPANDTHTTIQDSLDHAAPGALQAHWVRTDAMDLSVLSSSAAVWCAPASPYRSLEGALQGIRYARENGVPFLGTCAGFQHAIIEFARNVLGLSAAVSEEYDATASCLFVSRLACSLRGGSRMKVRILPGTLAHRLYSSDQAEERYYCNFGFNPAYRDQMEKGGARFSATDQEGEVRVFELPAHRFFVGTLFVPQTSSSSAKPHPIIAGFAAAAQQFGAERSPTAA